MKVQCQIERCEITATYEHATTRLYTKRPDTGPDPSAGRPYRGGATPGDGPVADGLVADGLVADGGLADGRPSANGDGADLGLDDGTTGDVGSDGAAGDGPVAPGDGGVVLDPTGIALSSGGPGTGGQIAPSVAFGGGQFLVAWADFRAGNYDIYASLVGTDGALRSVDIAVCTDGAQQSNPGAGYSSGGPFLVGWEDSRGDYKDLYDARVDALGSVLDPAGRVLSSSPANQTRPVLACGTGRCLVVWRESPGYQQGLRVDGAGAALDPTPITLAGTGTDQVAVACRGDQCLVAWREGTSADGDIGGARLDLTSGAVLDPAGIAICADAGAQGSPAVAASGGGYLVAWTDFTGADADIYGARVDAAGKLLDPAGIGISTAAGTQLSSAAASDGSGFLVAWEDNRSADADIYGARVDAAGKLLDPAGFPICAAAGIQRQVALAHGDGGYLVVWNDGRGSTPLIYGARVR